MKNISMAISSLPLIQEGQLSVTGKRMFTIKVLVNWLGGLPRNSVDRLTDCARNDLKKCRRAVKLQHNHKTVYSQQLSSLTILINTPQLFTNNEIMENKIINTL